MIFHVTEGSRHDECMVCGKPTDNFDGTRNPGCLLTPDKDHRLHILLRGVYVYADPLPVCEWHEGCERRPIVGGDLCFEHDQQWRAENPPGDVEDNAARAEPIPDEEVGWDGGPQTLGSDVYEEGR